MIRNAFFQSDLDYKTMIASLMLRAKEDVTEGFVETNMCEARILPL